MTVPATKKELRAAWQGDNDDFNLIHEEVHPWWNGTHNRDVWQRASDGTYWCCFYQRSEDGSFDGMDREVSFDLFQVWPREVTTTVYDDTPPGSIR